jgi:hypothetical protein
LKVYSSIIKSRKILFLKYQLSVYIKAIVVVTRCLFLSWLSLGLNLFRILKCVTNFSIQPTERNIKLSHALRNASLPLVFMLEQ